MADKVADKPTRFAADLIDAAAIEGPLERRSGKMQLEHWARVGMHVSMRDTAARRRVEAVLAGDADLSELNSAERSVANAEIDVLVVERARAMSLGAAAAAAGITTVALDDDERLVSYSPDGTTTVLEAE